MGQMVMLWRSVTKIHRVGTQSIWHFIVSKFKPGTVPICHFLVRDSLLWVSN
ncbi:hypothetical protein Gohar_006115 [Gossypium harknessii]|uniref:BURP domain-containing protein n=1 Tax=Gossypium harknessii TaxID=34285 RepID=A0A7J9GCL6_9ROSI|nr:hypothetical protein [Gossypium harknessii]